MRKSPTAAYERLPMARTENGSYEGMLFDVAEPVEYFIEAAGVRSPVFNLKVVELPYVKQLDLEYHFPSYTGLAPRTVEDGGDIAALRGTNVNVKVTPTMTAQGGRILLDDGIGHGADGQRRRNASRSVTVAKQGFYRVELDAAAGEKVAASPQYTIDLLSDQAPSVTLSKPGRDTNATPVEEFFVEARADDDFAVRDLQLVVLDQRRRREDAAPLRRQEADAGSDGRSHVLPRGAGRSGRRLGVVLRAGARQRHR